MSDTIIKKLKKYVLYISAIFFVSLGAHLIYSYLYHDAISEAIEGGTISEAIIGGFPHFNPLVPSNDHNTYINGLLYRSMLQYSTESDSFVPDLVSCNIDNLLKIECVLDANLSWSDGSSITPEDIKATLNIISQTKVNPIIASLLENTIIETTKDSISFSNTSKDINFLHVFLQPIIPESVVNTLDTENIDGKFSEIGGIYSGRFVLKSISQDETVGITKITLGKNEQYFGNTMYISFLILNLFRDEAHFLKNKNSFNIFNDKNNVIGNTIPRLSNFEYTLSQFVGSFFNTETLPSQLRNYIAHTLDRNEIVGSVGNAKVVSSLNPFLSEQNIDTPLNSSFSLVSYLESQGFYSKKELLKSTLAAKTQQKNMSAETLTRLLEAQKKEKENIEEKKEIRKVQEDLKYITSPTTKKYNFASEDNILIQGSVSPGVDAVFINDYKLNGFTAGDDVFYYRLLESYDSIIEGENSYKVYYETGREKQLVEEFLYIYNTDSEKLEEIKKSFFDINTSEEEVKEEDSPTEITQPEAPISYIKTSLSTEQIQALDDLYYYNTDGEKFQIKIVYSQSDIVMEETATTIQKQLHDVGIFTDLVGLSLGDITASLRGESLEYDIMLIGINLGYFESNLFPYFHSSQVKNGYNFSNFKKLGLDILLEELKSNNLSTTKREELEKKILDILKEENTIKVFYTPKIQLLVDKNIKNFSFPSYIPDSKHRYFPLLNSYLSEKRIIQSEEKGFLGFFKYLLSIFTS